MWPVTVGFKCLVDKAAKSSPLFPVVYKRFSRFTLKDSFEAESQYLKKKRK